MQGKRLPDGFHHFDSAPGDYWKTTDGEWEAKSPTGDVGRLSNHDVIEHDDGTITVSPSILISQGDKELYHGYLEKGTWRVA